MRPSVFKLDPTAKLACPPNSAVAPAATLIWLPLREVRVPPPTDTAPPVPTLKRKPAPCMSMTPSLVKFTKFADTPATFAVLLPLLPRIGAIVALLRNKPVAVLLKLSAAVLPSPTALTSPKVTAAVISNNPLLVMVPAPSTSMLPALQVTAPSLVSDAPLFQLFSPPLMLNTAPVVTTSGADQAPALQVPVPRRVVVPLSAFVPPVKLKMPSTSRLPLPCNVPVPNKFKMPSVSIRELPFKAKEPAARSSRSVVCNPATCCAPAFKLTMGLAAPRSMMAISLAVGV